MRIWFRFGYGQVLFFVFMSLPFFVFSGCRRTADELPLTPPVTHPLSREYIGYGVVNVSFTHLLSEPGKEGISTTYIRRGTVVRISERRLAHNGGNPESWVFAEEYNGSGGALSDGWIPESTVDIYDNESRAVTASKAMDL